MLITHSQACDTFTEMFFFQAFFFPLQRGWRRSVCKVNLSWQASFIFYMVLKLKLGQNRHFLLTVLMQECLLLGHWVSVTWLSLAKDGTTAKRKGSFCPQAFSDARHSRKRCRRFWSPGHRCLWVTKIYHVYSHFGDHIYTVVISDQASKYEKGMFCFS